MDEVDVDAGAGSPAEPASPPRPDAELLFAAVDQCAESIVICDVETAIVYANTGGHRGHRPCAA